MLDNREDRIVRYLSGNLNATEKQAFELELEQSEDLNQLYKEFFSIWQLTGQIDYANDHVIESWHSFQQEVEAPKRILGFDWQKLAASILILAVVSVGIWYVNSPGNKEIQSNNTFVTQTFADNSSVELNHNSTLIIDKNYGNTTREMWLEGEASFNVTPSSKPFIVHTKQGDITVLGTQFNVYNDVINDFAMVELYNGSIQYDIENESIQLKPGDRLIFDRGVITLNQVKQLTRAWGNVIECKDMPLSYVLGQLKLHYNIDYQLKDKFLKEHYTVTLPTDDLDACLDKLSQLSDRKFALKNNVIVLK